MKNNCKITELESELTELKPFFRFGRRRSRY